MSYADKNMTCRDCGSTFVFTAGEQEFFAQKGFTNAPTRCAECRAQHKAARNSGDGRRGFGGGGGSREMFSAVCSSCGKEARVPFEPRGDRPIYCSDCFQSQRPQRDW